jgi:hypothetical protein
MSVRNVKGDQAATAVVMPRRAGGGGIRAKQFELAAFFGPKGELYVEDNVSDVFWCAAGQRAHVPGVRDSFRCGFPTETPSRTLRQEPRISRSDPGRDRPAHDRLGLRLRAALPHAESCNRRCRAAAQLDEADVAAVSRKGLSGAVP